MKKRSDESSRVVPHKNRHERDIVLVDKPKAISSFDVIRVLRKRLGIRKMGHAGTLDPNATGLMLIGIGCGTKKLHALSGLDKTYRVHARIGVRTDTGDVEGNVLERATVSSLDHNEVRSIVEGLTGTLMLPVPAYSAIKQGGVPLYKKVRAGETVETPVRPMTVHAARLESVTCADGSCVVVCETDVASGVYVRSVIEELGRRLRLPATVEELRRTRIGDFCVEDAETIEYDEKDIKRKIVQKR